jgi:hypothetical protein
MQHIAKPTPDRGNTQTQSVLITALFLFALAGGIMGFAVGAFTHSRQGQQPTDTNIKPTQPAIAKTQPSPTATPIPVPLGPPLFRLQSGTPGITQTVYTVQATKENTDIPLTTSGITCHLALVKGNGANKPNINSAQFQVSNVQNNYIQEEIPNSLQFDTGTPEIQPCQNGQGNWKVTINTSGLKKERYYSLVGLTIDSLHYNFSYVPFFLNKEGILVIV